MNKKSDISLAQIIPGGNVDENNKADWTTSRILIDDHYELLFCSKDEHSTPEESIEDIIKQLDSKGISYVIEINPITKWHFINDCHIFIFINNNKKYRAKCFLKL